MTEQKPEPQKLTDEEAREILRSLRHKEGNWIHWGKLCKQLQDAGHAAADIFEETGIEALVQNQVIVAAQVYDSIVEGQASPEVLAYCEGPRSDVLYELRILNQRQRLEAATLAAQKRLDMDGAHRLSHDIKAVACLAQIPEGFTRHPGDAVAYQCWKQAKRQRDLSQRARLIGEGLRFAETDRARQQLEALLQNLTAPAPRQAPLLPLYRPESSEELPRLLPFAGEMPLTATEIEAVAAIAPEEPFQITRLPSDSACVPVPGWQVVLKARDPVALLTSSESLPNSAGGVRETVIVAIDRGQRDWDENSYFLVQEGQQVRLAWFEEAPSLTILGQLLLVLRPKRILDEGNITEPWQMDD
ncbi:RuBisCO accumulation factor 1 [Sodalinema gerasimenkoae]|uniref:RuBisCO accumulation factor 1 n=1 Tax=Sodalinema gerasimenkoae TaxID=2862348 RepID=UPI001357D67B|nr:RuBisCO accumulation factor 1 [Sodalinema gerasimenkoae]